MLKLNIKELKKLLSKKEGVVSAYLFGSYSKGMQTKNSDVDLGVICKNKTGIDAFSLSLDIEKAIGQKNLDVTICDLQSPPLLLMEIINGRVLYEKSSIERTGVEVIVLKLFTDDEHLRQIKNYYLTKSFEEGIYANK